jgi:hypothetical protein
VGSIGLFLTCAFSNISINCSIATGKKPECLNDLKPFHKYLRLQLLTGMKMMSLVMASDADNLFFPESGNMWSRHFIAENACVPDEKENILKRWSLNVNIDKKKQRAVRTKLTK